MSATVLFLLVFVGISYSSWFTGAHAGLATGLVVCNALVLLFSIVVHEFGHALAAKALGAGATAVLIDGLGGLAFCGHGDRHLKEIAISAAGPATHLLWIGIAIAALATSGKWQGLAPTQIYVDEPGAFALLLLQATWSWQVMLLAINALPILPGNDASHMVQTASQWCGLARTIERVYHLSWAVNALFAVAYVAVYLAVLGGQPSNLLFMAFLGASFAYQEYQLCQRLMASEAAGNAIPGMAAAPTADNDRFI